MKHARPGDTRQRGPTTGANTEQEGEGEDTEKRSYKKEKQGTIRSLNSSNLRQVGEQLSIRGAARQREGTPS